MFLDRKLLKFSLITLSTITSGTWFPANTQRREHPKTMYTILLWKWTNYSALARQLSVGQKTFIDKRCRFKNCYITRDTQLDHAEFDAIAFESKLTYTGGDLPRERKLRQKYVFASMETPTYYPLSSDWNGFFNWTWTYHLESDARWGFIVVRDSAGRVVGPRKEMHWIRWQDMAPVSNGFKNSLRTKTKAAAWFVTNCGALSKRQDYVRELQAELHKYNLSVDIFGGCGDQDKQCGGNLMENWGSCGEIIKRDYFFYLAFENSFCEDYVTEKILWGLNFNTIPIVYGTANYTRFMPDGSYLNAARMAAPALAAAMRALIRDRRRYADHFRWRAHYRYDDTTEDNPCNLCELLNNEEKFKQTTIYYDIAQWWNLQCQPVIVGF